MSEIGEFDPFIRPRVGEIAAARAEAARRGGEDLSFDDFLDLINPLHHLPIIGPIYREITGDKINPAAQVVGGLLFGGPVGMVSAATHAIAEEATGKSLLGHAMTALLGEDDTAVAESETEDAADTAATVEGKADADVLVGDGAALPEIAPAAGAEPRVESPATARTGQDPAYGDGPESSLESQDEQLLEGADALRAFLKDRQATTKGAQALPALDESPALVQKSHAVRGDGNSGGTKAEAPAPAEQHANIPSAIKAGRFMPVGPEHFTGRMAVRGPAGFVPQHPVANGAAALNTESGEGPFAARMMEALKKYSALQDSSAESAHQQ